MVHSIFNIYYKKFGYDTIAMGASFRNVGVVELAGCDYLTISPNLLEALYNSTDKIPQKLDSSEASGLDIGKRSYLDDEALFRFDFNEGQMAVGKLVLKLELPLRPIQNQPRKMNTSI